MQYHIDGLVQERCANALKLRLSCTNPLIYAFDQSRVEHWKIQTLNYLHVTLWWKSETWLNQAKYRFESVVKQHGSAIIIIHWIDVPLRNKLFEGRKVEALPFKWQTPIYEGSKYGHHCACRCCSSSNDARPSAGTVVSIESSFKFSWLTVFFHKVSAKYSISMHCGLVIPYGDIDLSQH